MKRYLLDTSICVFLFRKKYGIEEKLRKIGASQCYVSEVTIAELKSSIDIPNERSLFFS